MDMIKALYLGMKGILGSTGISCTVMSILKMGKNFFTAFKLGIYVLMYFQRF